MSTSNIEDSSKKTMLLNEWTTINQRIDNIDARIWQGAGILLVLSIGGFSFLGRDQSAQLTNFLSIIIISVFSLVILYIWLRVFNRWIYVQGMLGYRAREIEREMDFHIRFNWYARSIEYWEDKEDTKAFLCRLKENEPDAYNKLFKFYEDQKQKKLGRASIRTTLNWLTILLMAMWVFTGVLYTILFAMR